MFILNGIFFRVKIPFNPPRLLPLLLQLQLLPVIAAIFNILHYLLPLLQTYTLTHLDTIFPIYLTANNTDPQTATAPP